jgi:predicted DNA-binding transcriptional regulator AlpA
MNKTELEVSMLRKGVNAAALAERIGMNRVTLYRKMASGRFERSEIIKIRETLGLTEAEMLRIFFNEDSCVNATNREEV